MRWTKQVQRLACGALYSIRDNDHYQPKMIKPQGMHDVETLRWSEVLIGMIVR